MTTSADPIVDAPATRSERIGFGLSVENWRAGFEIANVLAKSALVPKAYQGRPEDVIVAMQCGAEIGLPPMAALQSIAVVNGKPALYGDGFLGVIMASRHYLRHVEYFVTPAGEEVQHLAPADLNHELTTAVSKFWRRGIPDPFVGTFSIADAKRAGLWTKDGNWKTYPQRMLLWRARGFAGRNGFAPELRGLKLAAEVEDYAIDRIEAPIGVPVRRSEKSEIIGRLEDGRQVIPKPAPAEASEPVITMHTPDGQTHRLATAPAPVEAPREDPAPPPPARQEPPPSTPARQAPPAPATPPAPRQGRPTAVAEPSTADVVITDTAMIQARGVDPFYEVCARVATPGQPPIAYKFVCRDKAMFDLAASVEGSDRLYSVVWSKGTRHDGTPCKVLEQIEAAE
jgi:hypothetical protein